MVYSYDNAVLTVGESVAGSIGLTRRDAVPIVYLLRRGECRAVGRRLHQLLLRLQRTNIGDQADQSHDGYDREADQNHDLADFSSVPV